MERGKGEYENTRDPGGLGRTLRPRAVGISAWIRCQEAAQGAFPTAHTQSACAGRERRRGLRSVLDLAAVGAQGVRAEEERGQAGYAPGSRRAPQASEGVLTPPQTLLGEHSSLGAQRLTECVPRARGVVPSFSRKNSNVCGVVVYPVFVKLSRPRQ